MKATPQNGCVQDNLTSTYPHSYFICATFSLCSLHRKRFQCPKVRGAGCRSCTSLVVKAQAGYAPMQAWVANHRVVSLRTGERMSRWIMLRPHNANQIVSCVHMVCCLSGSGPGQVWGLWALVCHSLGVWFVTVRVSSRHSHKEGMKKKSDVDTGASWQMTPEIYCNPTVLPPTCPDGIL